MGLNRKRRRYLIIPAISNKKWIVFKYKNMFYSISDYVIFLENTKVIVKFRNGKCETIENISI